ncbi:MAG: glutaminyl-peptide cyclotransferase [Candidatus Omnitrophica bacterium]|nr:glutaminyl-peptide cyclotransferase [Candidatus Omnitrophota bacterium]
MPFLRRVTQNAAGCLLCAFLFYGATYLSSHPENPPGLPAPLNGTPPRQYTYRIVNRYYHDRHAFTQGLTYEDGFLYEGTGIKGHSTLRKIDLETGRILRRKKLSSLYFGEGITFCNNVIVQLTLSGRRGFVYNRDTFEMLRHFEYPTEGWGITFDGTHLIMSDGSSTLYFLDSATFKGERKIEVFDDRGPVRNLNELEYIEGEVYANVLNTDRIARISPETGRVTGWIDLRGLLSTEERSGTTDVLNGIAYDAGRKRLFVTGKLWPSLFEIELVAVDK